MKASELPSNELARCYIELRDRRAQRKAAYENDDASDKAKQEKIEALFMTRMAAEGIESLRTEAGTVYKARRVTTSVVDRDAFFQFVKQTDSFHMLEARASKDAIRQFKETNNDLPPGINWSEAYVINVRRS